MKRAHEVEGGRVSSPAGDVWPVVFDTGDGMPIAGDPEVARLLTLASQQVDMVQRALHARHLEEATYAKYLTAIRHALSLRHLQATWQQVAMAPFSEPVIASMEMAAGLLDETEPAITIEQMSDVRKIVAEFREAVGVSAADVPPVVVGFLLRQAALIEGALRAYPIVGAKAFRDASDAAIVDVVEHAQDVREYIDATPVVLWARLWPRVAKVCRGIAVISIGVGAACKDVTAAINLLDGYHALPPAAMKVLAPFVDTNGGEHPAIPRLSPAADEIAD